MKKPHLMACSGATALMLVAPDVFAQSSVTLYGLVDTTVRYLTNADSNNNGLVAMGEGVETPSRWGLKGSEDLGGGLSAVFRLENQFQLWSGKLDNTSNQLFQRQCLRRTVEQPVRYADPRSSADAVLRADGQHLRSVDRRRLLAGQLGV